MTSSTPLERVPLRDRIYDIVRERIVRGDLAPGTAVRDIDLARSLGASRTPVREALIRLTSEGLLANHVGRGFHVRPLLRKDVEEIYPLLWTLEPLAVESSAPLTRKQEAKLERLVRGMENRRADAPRRHDLDTQWHRELLSGCDNTRLLKCVEELRGALRRYETAYLAGMEGMEDSVAEHRAITAAFSENDRTRAATLLRDHWHRGMGELLAILPAETE